MRKRYERKCTEAVVSLAQRLDQVDPHWLRRFNNGLGVRQHDAYGCLLARALNSDYKTARNRLVDRTGKLNRWERRVVMPTFESAPDMSRLVNSEIHRRQLLQDRTDDLLAVDDL